MTGTPKRNDLRAVAVGALLLGVDGFDVMSVSVAAPAIAIEWDLDRSQLGWLLATEVIGAAVGAAVLGRLADVYGRRTIILCCLFVMVTGMALTALARHPIELASIRLATGIGLGGLNPAVTSMVSEVAKESERDRSVALLGLGYAIGGIVGGASAGWLVSSGTWRTIFVAGSLVTALAFFPAIRCIPETLRPQRRRRRMVPTNCASGHTPGVPRDAPVHHDETTAWRGRNAKNAAILTVVCMTQLSTFYFSLKWLPKLAVDAGMTATSGALALTFFNIGGLAGMLAMAPLIRVTGLKAFTMIAFISSGAATFVLALTLGHGTGTIAAACVAGLMANAAFGGLYATVARSFPGELRSTGVGLTLGLGRGGAAFAPVATGFLFNAGVSVPAVALVMTFALVVAAGLIACASTEH